MLACLIQGGIKAPRVKERHEHLTNLQCLGCDIQMTGDLHTTTTAIYGEETRSIPSVNCICSNI